MSIFSIDRENYKQKYKNNDRNKELYGEILTPFSLISDMFDMFNEECFHDKNYKWLDIGAGTGYFSMYLFWKLCDGLKYVIPNESERKTHIVKNMIYMSELREENIYVLENMFGIDSNIISGDFLEYETDFKFDYIIGNPPYNCNGLKKVPTNSVQDKKKDGKTIWIPFIKHSINLLRENGKLMVIIPSIWMKPDKAQMYYYLTKYKIHKLKCLSNTQSNSYFKGGGQTPTCYFLLENVINNSNLELLNISIYDYGLKKYIDYEFISGEPIPVFGQSVIMKMKKFIKYGKLNVIKTSLPSKNIQLTNKFSQQFCFQNIKTCKLNGLLPYLVINYSNEKLKYYGKKKLVMAHKMYGFPYLDLSGEFGISNRDNYVILSDDTNKLKKIQKFLSTKTALYLFECTRYRMKYLEKYIFELIPDITELPDFPQEINDETIFNYFGFNDEEKLNIQKLHKRNYCNFIDFL